MKKRKNIKVESASGSPFLLDAFVPEDASTCPVVVFAHGFKGFKDWGCWDLVAKEFVEAGYAFVKFNFSHNGTTPEAPQDFADLDKFGNNNFTKELQDLDAVLDWVEEEANRQGSIEIDSHHISLIGHSRGGGISIIKAAQNERVKALITWASVARLDYGWHEKDHYIREWKEKGVQYIYNGRTKQMMPLYYQLYENFEQHKEAYDISSAL
ncbi:MAG TPA: hypothetical protein ENJ45_01690, partial [Phaeodactylibacter sp.]|nr:hypothetical protein [Phaeodactylibacter sp.]